MVALILWYQIKKKYYFQIISYNLISCNLPQLLVWQFLFDILLAIIYTIIAFYLEQLS